MSIDQVADLTRAFYAWERRGRGWRLYPYRVELEPPVVDPEPSPPSARGVDDARSETWLSSLFSGKRQTAVEEELEPEEVSPPEMPAPPMYETVSLSVPEDCEVPLAASAGWLRSLSASCFPVSWELVGADGRVSVELSCAEPDVSLVADSLHSFFPEVIAKPEEHLVRRWQAAPASEEVGVEFGLGSEFMLPLHTLGGVRPDPLAPIIAALGRTREQEFATLQILATPVEAAWDDAIVYFVTTADGKPFFADAPEVTSGAMEKIRSPLLAAALRLAIKAESMQRAWEVVRGVAGGLAQLASPRGNEFIPVSTEDPQRVVLNILERSTHRHGMILSVDELVGLMRLPSASVKVEALERVSLATKSAPPSVRGEGVLLGTNEHHGEEAEVRLDTQARLRHTHVIGASGTGKSTLLVSMMLDDIKQGHGVAVLDPHGDLVDDLLTRLPSERLDDVVLFDPADPEYVVGWNILGANTELEKELLASDLTATFQRLATSWGDQMSTVLSNAVLAFLNSERLGTLFDLRQFLVDEKFRKEFLGTVTDEYIAAYWREDFALIAKRRPQAPILTRLNTFLRNRLVRDVVTLREGHIDFRELMDGRRIFLARLSQGAIGEENAALLGSLLVSKIHQVTLSRQDVAKEERSPFFLYLDEFHELATPSMATMFSGVRKYGLAMTVAHQDLYQLQKTVPAVERAVLANANTRICFRVGDEDAKRLSDGFGSFAQGDLTDLGVGEAIMRVGKRTDDFNVATFDLPKVDRREAETLRGERKRRVLERWGVARKTGTAEKVIEEAEPKTMPESDPGAIAEPKDVVSPEFKTSEAPPRLDKLYLDYLELVAIDPFLQIRERNEHMGLSAWKGQRLKTALTNDGFVREVPINPGGRGKWFMLLELTKLGKETLAEFGITPSVGHGRGGIAHQWWVNTIAEWLKEQGFSVDIEDESEGVRVDLVFSRGGKKIAVEVQTSPGHEVENFEKNFRAGFEYVVMLVDGSADALRNRLTDRVSEAPAGVLVAELQEYSQCLTQAIQKNFVPLPRAKQKEEPKRARPRRRRSEALHTRSAAEVPYLPEPGVLTTPAAAEYVGLSPATLETMRTRGGGPVFVKLGSRVVYRREDLDSWVKERRRKSTSE